VADKGVERGERLAGQRILAGVDESYFDADDEFWAPIREADERDAAGHERAVRQDEGCRMRSVQRRREAGGAARRDRRRRWSLRGRGL